jgi:NADH dehydrogenase [ubiquinone] 1 alpha subcomplex assembly factor 6
MQRQTLGHCAKEVQRFDPDRFLTALFAPAPARDALFTLYAFNLEIAKIRESVSESILADMRLQWWRDAIDGIYNGVPPQHPVVQPLHNIVESFGLERENFDALINARALDLTAPPPKTLEGFIRYGADTTTPLVLLALELLGPLDNALRSVARNAATAWAVTGLLRALPSNLRHRRNYLPTDMMIEHRVDPTLVAELKPSNELAGLIEAISNVACEKLDAVRERSGAVQRKFLSPLLIASMARQYNRRFARTGYNIFDPAFTDAPPLRAWPLVMSAVLGRI